MITDIMSHSQFHRIKWFILGHAWLNLWDKHMTTGRINQVTYVCVVVVCRGYKVGLRGGGRVCGWWVVIVGLCRRVVSVEW